HVAHHEPERREATGHRRYQDLGDVELGGDVDGMHGAGTAEGDEREVARIVAAADRDRARGAGHGRVDDAADAPGGLERAHAEPASEAPAGTLCEVAVERHLAAEPL